MRRNKFAAVAAAALASTLLLSSCSGEASEGGDENSITVWTLESIADRMEATEKILDSFKEKTGITVNLVGVEEEQIGQLLQSSALSGDLPDVAAAIPLGVMYEAYSMDVVDTEVAGQVVKDLGKDTFQDNALSLTRPNDTQIGVPADGWSQILLYRSDLFKEAGLEPPTTYENLAKAAETLNKDGRFGITLGTDASDAFTQQSFEALALGNDCQLVDNQGNATIDSDNCKATFELYNTLAANSPQGAQTFDSARAAYFNGSAAMTMWSTYILDELAGLRSDALPSCEQCGADPSWLAENTGIVVKTTGPNGSQDAGSYGEVTSFVPFADGNAEASKQFIEYMMDEGYMDWLAMAPEGKFPMRTGTQAEPTKFTDGWGKLDAGVDTRKPLGEIFDPEVIASLSNLGDDINRWALVEGQGDILGSFSTELPLAKAIAEMTAGSLTPEQAAENVASSVNEMK